MKLLKHVPKHIHFYISLFFIKNPHQNKILKNKKREKNKQHPLPPKYPKSHLPSKLFPNQKYQNSVISRCMSPNTSPDGSKLYSPFFPQIRPSSCLTSLTEHKPSRS